MLGVISYGSAALLYGVTAVIVVASSPRSRRAVLLAAAVVTSGVWAGGIVMALMGAPFPVAVLIGLDALHLFVWTACVVSWLPRAATRRWLLVGSAAAGLFAVTMSWPTLEADVVSDNSYPGLVLAAMFAVLAVEQVYRNAQDEARRQLRLLCVAAGGIATTDIFVYSHAALLGAPETIFWEARGFANVLVLPLIVLSVRKQPGWERELFVSRDVVFYTASLLGVGAYLLAMGVVAYVIRAIGAEWSFRLDLAFLVAGCAGLLVALFSSSIRGRFRVSVLKHFFRSKYDYRAEWLRLTQILSRTGDLQQSAASGLEGLARIIGSPRGDLYVERDGYRYDWLCSLGKEPPPAQHYDREHPLVAFLAQSRWVVDSEEYAAEPHRYGTAFGHPDEAVLPESTIVVPLEQRGHLQGFVLLGKPAGFGKLNFDDHDILKTAGRQVAAVLAQALVQEKLAETRQFEAMNRLSAFLMHDLKNVVAQQSLVLANAERFKHRPDFIDDAFATIRGGTERIKKVLEELAAASRTKTASGRVDVSKVLMEVRSQCADREPVPEIQLEAQPAWVRMDRDELTSAILHLVRNAQDATPPDGKVTLRVGKANGQVTVTIADTGCGMDVAFLRDRLFRPFDSTKGEEGMGIGAYQARHIVRRAGGELDVSSGVGRGTCFTIELPASE